MWISGINLIDDIQIFIRLPYVKMFICVYTMTNYNLKKIKIYKTFF